MVFLPECFDFIARNNSENETLTQDLEKMDLIGRFCQLAQKNQIWLALGGFHNKVVRLLAA